jgi:branched-chain amino acid transport system ATP-binding protein
VRRTIQGRNSNPQDILLEITGLGSGYGDIRVLSEISFAVSRGNIISLIGSNGAGKTTLLKTIAGLIRPFSGSILFSGRRLDSLSVERIVESGVVYVPSGRGLFPEMSVLENLEMGSFASHARRHHAENLKEVYSLFPILESRKKQAAGTLSGGEAQMLAIGRGIMANPTLLMLDEPSAGISPAIAENIFRAIERLRNEKGVTLLVVEQDAYRSLKLSDYAYVLENGRIALGGRGEELLDNQHVCEAYLGA